MGNHLRQNLAKILSSANAPVERLGKDTYVINGIVAKRQGTAWELVTKQKERYTVYHSKIAVMLPWLITRVKTNTHAWLLQQHILKLDREYSWAVFDIENKERVLNSYIKRKDKDGAIIMATKFDYARSRLKDLNLQISKALSDIKINK